MNIKEIEELTGMTRANIRFYEGEGLITPKRNRENGYRIYSQEDVDALRKIRLLRLMEVPIEQIRTLQEQGATLTCTLEQQLEKLERQKEQMTRTQEVARQMIQRKEAYDTMDATMYLNALENGESLEKDVKPKLNLPWRRYWARILDFSVYNLIIFLLLPGIFGDRTWFLIRFGLDMLIFLLIESVLLAWFGTTPGKAVFGIFVTDLEGKRPSIRCAFDRTVSVARYGIGFNIPFLSQYLEWHSLKAVEEGRELPWETDTEINFRDTRNWRYALFLVLLLPVLAFPMIHRAEWSMPEDKVTTEYVGVSPLIYDYQVEEVLYSLAETPELPLVHFDEEQLYFCHTGTTSMGINEGKMEWIGRFRYAPPKDNPTAGVWELYNDSATESMYQLRVENDGSVILDFYERLEMQWSWRLSRIDTLDVQIQNEYVTYFLSPEWYELGAFPGNSSVSHSRKIHHASTITLIFQEGAPDQITIIEDIYQGTQIAVREHTTSADEYGLLSIEITPLESPEGAYSIFRVPYKGGEYVFCITYGN